MPNNTRIVYEEDALYRDQYVSNDEAHVVQPGRCEYMPMQPQDLVWYCVQFDREGGPKWANSRGRQKEPRAQQQATQKSYESILHTVYIRKVSWRWYLHFLSKSSDWRNQRVIASWGKGFPGSKERPPNQSRSTSSLGRVRTIIAIWIRRQLQSSQGVWWRFWSLDLWRKKVGAQLRLVGRNVDFGTIRGITCSRVIEWTMELIPQITRRKLNWGTACTCLQCKYSVLCITTDN